MIKFSIITLAIFPFIFLESINSKNLEYLLFNLGNYICFFFLPYTFLNEFSFTSFFKSCINKQIYSHIMSSINFWLYIRFNIVYSNFIFIFHLFWRESFLFLIIFWKNYVLVASYFTKQMRQRIHQWKLKMVRCIYEKVANGWSVEGRE